MNFMPAALTTSRAQRAIGRLNLSFRTSHGQTRIETFYQEGCLKARLPRPADPAMCEAVTLNISGGVAGGDALSTAITLSPGAQARVASQAAERIYRALDAPSRITTTITLAPGAKLDYLPQETILFDGFSLRRALNIDLAEDADFLGLETILFGRQAMRETIRTGDLHDRILVRRGGKILLQDMTRLKGDFAAQLTRTAIGNGAAAMACIIFAAPNAPARLPALRDILTKTGLPAGATSFEGVIFARHPKVLPCATASSRRSKIYVTCGPCRASGKAKPRGGPEK
jgi:urease accessory protein